MLRCPPRLTARVARRRCRSRCGEGMICLRRAAAAVDRLNDLIGSATSWLVLAMVLIGAYNAHEQDAYFKTFASPMDCYYSKVKAESELLRDSRAEHFRDRTGSTQHIQELRVIWSGAAEVGFIESGEVRSGERVSRHERGLIMRRLDGEWRVTVEVSREKNGCAPELFNDAPEPEVLPSDGAGSLEPPPAEEAPSVTPTVVPSAGSPPAEAPRP